MSAQMQFIPLQTPEWFEKQTLAGQVAAQCLQTARNLITHQAKISLKEIERACQEVMTAHQCTPTFLGYKGFPGAICASVNQQLVHGIPTDYQLQDGDVVKIDLGVTYQGAIADCAFTMIKGQPKSPKHVQLIEVCQLALQRAIQAVQLGKRLGVIGSAIHHTVKSSGFGLITNYGGHGIQNNVPHAQPFVANKAQPNTGIRFQPGLTLAIEPMLVLGDTRTRVLSDGWTVVTDDIGAHFEHTIMILEDQVKVITAPGV